jgi:hypothetical protein
MERREAPEGWRGPLDGALARPAGNACEALPLSSDVGERRLPALHRGGRPTVKDCFPHPAPAPVGAGNAVSR